MQNKRVVTKLPYKTLYLYINIKLIVTEKKYNSQV